MDKITEMMFELEAMVASTNAYRRTFAEEEQR
jgi:hypothetical protein